MPTKSTTFTISKWHKNGLNLSEDLFCDLHLFGLYFSHSIFTVSTFSKFWLRVWLPLSKILRTPLEQGSASYIPWAASGPQSQTSIRDPLCDYRKSLTTKSNPDLKLSQHLTKPFFVSQSPQLQIGQKLP